MAVITAVIPAYNREATLGATLEALVVQPFRDWEAVVVDDGSSDGTAAVAEAYASRDARIRVLRQANAGVSAARNRAIAAATGAWLLFLDADDWIAPDALAPCAAAAAAHPEAELVNGGCIRVLPDGTELEEDRVGPHEDLFAAFARTCAFSIHTSIVRTDLVRRLGGFDESLVTCEDWDLWQRVARVGAKVVAIPDVVGYYRVRPGSASRDGRRLVEDAFTVIERGHGRDERVEGLGRPVADPVPPHRARAARVYVAAYGAALEAASGRDPSPLLDLLEPGDGADVVGTGVADTLYHAVIGAQPSGLAGWTDLPEAVRLRLQDFIDALGPRVGDLWLSHMTTQALEELVLQQSGGRREVVIGRTQLAPVDCDGPVGAVELRAGVERLLLTVTCGASLLGTTVIPVAGRHVPALVIADAVADEHAWELLGRLFATTLYPRLDVVRDGEHVRVRRGGVVVGETRAHGHEPHDELVHAAAGWTVLLQELWGQPELSRAQFYAERAPGPPPASAPRVRAADLHVVEVADELPVITDVGAPLDVPVSVAGVPLARVRVLPERGTVSPHALRCAITHAAGFELCVIAVREGVLLHQGPPDAPLRERLQQLARQRGARPDDDGCLPGWSALADTAVPAGTGALLLGRHRSGPLGGASTRLALLPAGAADDVAALSASTGQPAVRVGAPAIDTVLYAPFVVDPRQDPVEFGPRSRGRAEASEQRLRAGAGTRSAAVDVEQRRAAVLAMVPDDAARALEVGCGDGVLTAALATRVAHVTAVDIAWSALQRARGRCAAAGAAVDLRRLDVFTEPLPGGQDVVVCGNVLRWAGDRRHLRHAARYLATAVRHGGALIMATAAADAPAARGALLATGELAARDEVHVSDAVVARYERVGRVRGARGRVRRPRLGRPAADPDGGQSPRRDVEAAAALPILMYHRVAWDGHAGARRWRVTPDELEAQLAHLRDQGFRSTDVEQWASVVGRDGALAERGVALTFDDGFADFAEHALPLLERYGFRAEVFVVTGHVGGLDAWDVGWDRRERLMDWDTLLALPSDVVRIGAHTVHHPALTALGPEEVLRELIRSRMTLEDRLGRPVSSIAYPFGLVDGAVQRLAGAAGYEVGYTTEHSWAYPTRRLLCLPRLEIRGGMDSVTFARELAGP